jgi:pilus assembly protein Flp/PilA
LRDESGATSIEYSLIAAGITLAIVVVVNTIGSNVNTMLQSVSAGFK